MRPNLPKLDNKSDLAVWLGLNPNELNWHADLWRSSKLRAKKLLHYNYFTQEKKRTRTRVIEAPKVNLKVIQRKILDQIVVYAAIHDAAMGFRKQLDCIKHADIHTNKKYVICFDIENYFQSISWQKVYRFYRYIGYEGKVAQILCGLSTHTCNSERLHQPCIDEKQINLLSKRHLPQGSPTSPAIANAVTRVLDCRLFGLAKSLNLSYSRYADDLSFSSNHERDWRFLETVV